MGSSASLNTLRQLALSAAVLTWAASAQAEGCALDHLYVKGGFGEARFSIELADEPDERAQGLMHRESLPSASGMLFVFERPQPAAFWMKNTLIPLDMIFTDRSGVITHIHENAIPHDETPIPGGQAVYAVLEVNGGMSRKLGLGVGDALQHPAFEGGPAALSCKD